jgi:hypothetical protein
MASYKEIFGTNIEVLSSDPPNPVEGQVWYNSTDNVVKGAAATTAGAWSTGGSLNTGRRAMGGAGTQTAALGIGGIIQPASPPFTTVDQAKTESYDGTSWTEVNDLNTARSNAARGSGGTQTSALYFAGIVSGTPSALTESWNGTSWTEVNDLNTARYGLSGAGADNTSMLAFGGNPGPVANTETWNGTSWTEVNDLNTARYSLAGFGIVTSALATTGEDPTGRVTLTESWNGTSWTEVADTNADRDGAGSAGTDNTSGLIFGGFQQAPVDSRVNKTELWNGTSWSEEADLTGTTYSSQTGAGTATAAISFGGEGPSNQMRTGTEEWLGAGAPLTRTFTDS